MADENKSSNSMVGSAIGSIAGFVAGNAIKKMAVGALVSNPGILAAASLGIGVASAVVSSIVDDKVKNAVNVKN